MGHKLPDDGRPEIGDRSPRPPSPVFRRAHKPLALLLLLLWASVSGCEYYNTFYNARKLFKDAERNRREAESNPSTAQRLEAAYRSGYYTVIAKASAVLDLHPTSKWVDDSLLLIGKAYYWREEYDDALLKFRELPDNFPGSPLVEEAVYWEGLTLRAQGRIDDAREVLREFGTAADSRFSEQARLALAELEAEAGNDEGAVLAYLGFLDQAGKNNLKARAWKGLGDAYLRMAQYEDAIDAYRHVIASKSSPLLSFESRIQTGNVLERQGKLPDALQTYTKILKVKRLRPYEPQVWLKQADIHRQMGQLETALEIYEKVIVDYPRSDFSADAYYRMGVIEQRHRKNAEQAKEFFDKARREKGNSEAAILARQMQNDLRDLERYRKAVEKGGEKGLEALFNLAELYLFNFSEIDSALATYQKALDMGNDTDYAPKALYAIGLIYADSLQNADAARGIFQRLIDAYPQVSYAQLAKERIQHQRTDDALAEARFLEAETLRREGMPPDEALNILRQIASEYPQSFYAPKALYTVAWIYENERQNLDTAREYYQKLVNDYPLTHFAKVAGDKLKGGFLDPPVEEARTDSSNTTPASEVQPATKASPQDMAPAKTPKQPAARNAAQPERAPAPPPAQGETALDFEEVDEKPQVLASEMPEYPVEALDEGLKGMVAVSLLIGTDGRVKRAEAVSGPEVFHQAAVNAAYQYRFKPGKHGGEPCEVWMEIPIHFSPPD